MISFKTDHEQMFGGRHNYTITVETDIKRYYESIQAVARDCVDDSTKSHIAENETVKPQALAVDTPTSTGVYYVCDFCECDLSPTTRGFFIYCPRCGKRIDYSDHDFLKEGLNAIC